MEREKKMSYFVENVSGRTGLAAPHEGLRVMAQFREISLGHKKLRGRDAGLSVPQVMTSFCARARETVQYGTVRKSYYI